MKRIALTLQLTPREEETARLLAKGMARKEIAAQMNISVYTVAANLERIRLKSNTHSMNAARCFFARFYPYK
jgi:DNA-binding CsgD family transcriptional regulator